MDVKHDPLTHLSTAVSLLPRTLAGVGFSLPVGLSEMDQTKAFFDHMYRILQKDQKSGTMSLDKGPGPNPRTIEKEWDGAGKRCSEERNQNHKLSSLESVEMMQQGSTRSRNSNASPKPTTIHSNEAGKSLEGQQLDVKLESSEFTELQPQHNINSHSNKLNSNTNRSVVETHEVAKESSEGINGDTNLKFVKATMLKPWPSINAIANNLSPSLDNTNPNIAKAGNINFEGEKQYCSSESVGFINMKQPHRNTIRVSELSPIPDRMMLQKDEVEKINSGEKSLDFRNADAVLESGRSISSGPHNPRQVPDKREMEKNISFKNSSHPEQTVESREIGRRPGLGLMYNISPFTLLQKSEKAKQVIPVDFTVLDHMSDANAFTKKAYELEAAVKEIEKLGGEPKIIGERVFKVVEDDQPRKCRPGLGLQMEQSKFVPLPMRPLPAKVHYACACAYKSKAPAQSAISPETTKAKASSGSKNESPSSISNTTKEVPRMNLHASSSLQKLLSIIESCADDEEKAVSMIFDWLNLKPTVITPLVIPEFPKCSVFDSVRSPWRQLPSIERVRELREEDPLAAFEELKRKFFTRSPAADYSDDDNTPSVRSGSFRSPSTSPGCNFSFEDEEIDTPSLAGPSGNPNVENEEFPCQEKVPEMISDTRVVKNFSEEAVASDYAPSNDYVPDEPEMGAPLNDYVPDEPEMGSPCNNLRGNTEVVSSMLLENSPVNAEVAPSDIVLENRSKEGSLKETSSRKGKKRGLQNADSSLDMQSEIPVPTTDTNTMAQAETSLMEPPTERDEQMAPPKKRTRKQEKKRSSIKIIEGGLKEVDGVRRSTRIRSRPLRHWMGERFLYARIEDEFPTAVGLKECSPATLGLRVKVKSFVSDKHADFVARIAK